MKSIRVYLVFALYRYDVDTPSSRLDQQVNKYLLSVCCRCCLCII